MLSMADQQLLTGYAILIAGLVRANDRDSWNQDSKPYPGPTSTDQEAGKSFPPSQLKYQNAHFMLVLYLSCLSSSSHLACILTLKNYFAKHRDAIVSRLFFVYVFALLLSTMIAITLPFQPLRVAFHHLFGDNNDYCVGETEPCFSDKQFDSESNVSRTLPILYLILVMYPFLLLALHLPIMGISRVRFRERFLDFVSIKRTRTPESGDRISAGIIYLFRDAVALLCRYLFFGSLFIVFCQQLVFFAVSLVFVFAQRFAQPPEWNPWNAYGFNNPSRGESSSGHYCSLDGLTANKWGFGQILPMILLFQPALTALGSFQRTCPPPILSECILLTPSTGSGNNVDMPPQESLAENFSASFPHQQTRRRPPHQDCNRSLNTVIASNPSIDAWSLQETTDGDLSLQPAQKAFQRDAESSVENLRRTSRQHDIESGMDSELPSRSRSPAQASGD